MSSIIFLHHRQIKKNPKALSLYFFAVYFKKREKERNLVSRQLIFRIPPKLENEIRKLSGRALRC